MEATINGVPVARVADIYLEQDREFLFNMLSEWCSLDVVDEYDGFSSPFIESMSAMRVDPMMRRAFTGDSRFWGPWCYNDSGVVRGAWFTVRGVRVRSKRKEVK